MSSPIRLRLLRLCADDPMTNKQLATAIGVGEATALHHVRVLVRTGFLAPEPYRTSSRGRRERPYRNTGKSYQLDICDPVDHAGVSQAMMDAFVDEVRTQGRAALLESSRARLWLSPATAHELQNRILDLIEGYVDRSESTETASDAIPYALYVGLHVRQTSDTSARGGEPDEPSQPTPA